MPHDELLTRDPAQFPQHARLAAVSEALTTASSLLDHLAAAGLHLCTQADDATYTPAVLSRNELLTGWAGIDFEALLQEKRDLAAQIMQEQIEQVRAAAVASLQPRPAEG